MTEAKFYCAMPGAVPPRGRCYKQCPHCASVERSNIGYTACWQADKDGRHCRKPQGHEDDHAYA